MTSSDQATHQTLRQQGRTEENGYTHLADRTFSVAPIEKKKKINGLCNNINAKVRLLCNSILDARIHNGADSAELQQDFDILERQESKRQMGFNVFNCHILTVI